MFCTGIFLLVFLTYLVYSSLLFSVVFKFAFLFVILFPSSTRCSLITLSPSPSPVTLLCSILLFSFSLYSRSSLICSLFSFAFPNVLLCSVTFFLSCYLLFFTTLLCYNPFSFSHSSLVRSLLLFLFLLLSSFLIRLITLFFAAPFLLLCFFSLFSSLLCSVICFLSSPTFLCSILFYFAFRHISGLLYPSLFCFVLFYFSHCLAAFKFIFLAYSTLFYTLVLYILFQLFGTLFCFVLSCCHLLYSISMVFPDQIF